VRVRVSPLIKCTAHCGNETGNHEWIDDELLQQLVHHYWNVLTMHVVRLRIGVENCRTRQIKSLPP
jgi:hypothetical protein